LVREISVRLGVPCYAGAMLTFSGQVTARTPGPDGDRCIVSVAARCGLGDHIIATAGVDVPGGPAWSARPRHPGRPSWASARPACPRAVAAANAGSRPRPCEPPSTTPAYPRQT